MCLPVLVLLAQPQIYLNNQTTSSLKYDVHTKFHANLIYNFDIIVSALVQDKMTYPA